MLGSLVKSTFLKVVKRFLTPPATSPRAEQLLSRAGLLLEEKRANMDPERVNRILFNRENCILTNFDLEG